MSHSLRALIATKSSIAILFAVTTVNLLTPPPATAAVSQNEANRLGSSLTAMGANPKGNSAGTIPRMGDQAPANVASDELLYTVSAANLEQHRAKLTPGQIALLTRYPGFEMRVYPSTRHQCYPNNIEAGTRRNAVNASLTRDTRTPINVRRGVAFPIPKSGLEAIFNHLVRPQPAVMAIATEAIITHYKNPTIYNNTRSVSMQLIDNGTPKNVRMTAHVGGDYKSLSIVNFGDMTLAQGQRTWAYFPGRRRVRRTTDRFDNPASFANGQMTADSVEIFSGAPHRYDWPLEERPHEILMGYGAERSSATLSDIAARSPSTAFPDPEALSYQLHRAYRIEATTRAGARHIYHRRDIYLDEDSWIAVAADLYDARGRLWRTHQGFIGRHADSSGDAWCLLTDDVSYDIEQSAYMMTRRNITPDGAEITADDFTPNVLRNKRAEDFFK